MLAGNLYLNFKEKKAPGTGQLSRLRVKKDVNPDPRGMWTKINIQRLAQDNRDRLG